MSGTGRSTGVSHASRDRLPPRAPSSASSTISISTPTGPADYGGKNKVWQSPVAPKNYLPYQTRGGLQVILNPFCTSNKNGGHNSVPKRLELDRTHSTMRLGLGTPLNNLKTSHLVNAKKNQEVPNPMRKIVPECRKIVPSRSTHSKHNSGSCLSSQMKKLTIYESPGRGDDGGGDTNNLPIFDKTFKALEVKANAYAMGQKVSFILYGKTIKVQKVIDLLSESTVTTGPNDSKDKEEVHPIPVLCSKLRSLFGWKMSLHIRWKYLEERVAKWPSKLTQLSVEEVAALLKISGEQLRLLQIVPDLKEMLRVLRGNVSHINTPNISKMLALSELQQGNTNAAARYLTQSQGMFLHSDIIDKHFNYIRRNEESVSETPRNEEEVEREAFKTSLFLSQVEDTLQFCEPFFKSDGESEFIKTLSSFDPNWNIIQLSTSVHSTNRFSNDLIGRRQVPQLILSAFCHVPGVSSRCQFTAFCNEPQVDVGSMMRFGLIEEFQKVLDKNLAISDESMIISRKKYWEERAKHNDSMEGVMYAMEEWISPWTFLLPGRINDEKIQHMIEDEVLSDVNMKNATESQKLLISRLTENYSKLPVNTKLVLDTLVAYILEIDEEAAHCVVRKIEEIGFCIYTDAPRHPTILILDQEIDVLPWDWIPCLRNTDVTRMPSLNLINSSHKLCSSLKQTYPVIVEPEKCTFILNPDGTLPNVQQRMEEYLTGRKEWVPIIGRSPTTQEMQDCLENQDLLLYCGHGAGSNYYPEYAVQKLVCRAVPLLMGCSSAQSHYTGPRLYANSVVNTYFIAGCASMVGFLWEVTDTECDRLTVDFLERWLPNSSLKPPKMPFFDRETKREKEKYLPTALRKSRSAATQLLTQCAVVCYGLPVATISS